MAKVSDIKAIVQSGKATIGTWLQIPSTEVAEIVGRAGYDWVTVDLEHGSFSRVNLSDIFRAIVLGGTVPFARVADLTMTSIKTALDSGARGLIFPMIENRAQLNVAIDFALYPPDGTRGVGYCRANLFGKDFERGLAENMDTFFCAQIEHIRAVDALDEILVHPKLDAIMVGPYDLSGSMNLTGQFEHPDFIAVIDTIAHKAEKYEMPMGIHMVRPEPEQLAAKIAEGYRFIAYGIDAVFLYRASERPML